MSTTEDTIKDIVVKIVHCERDILKPEATFQDMKADSLDMVQVLVALEDEFGIEIPDEDAQKFKNFGDFVNYVETKVAEKKGLMLSGKVALVTGSSRGIGRAIALKLAASGADVIINYFRHREDAEQVAADIRQMGVRSQAIRANIGDAAKIEEMFAEIGHDFGRLDILINNAASGRPRSALDLDTKVWEWTMDINARALLLCAQQAAKLMGPEGGRIVAISSVGSSFVLPQYAAIGISKATLEAITRYLAVELAPRGIAVNVVSASLVATETGLLYARGGKSEAEAPIPMPPAGRLVSTDDIANTVAFLCSEAAAMIIGQTIVIDGGTALAALSPPNKGE